MEAGEAGAPTDPAVVHVEEEQKPKVDLVTVHRHNMVVKPVQDQQLQVPAATQTRVLYLVRECFN